ncbi:GPI mannosyltransferase 1 [Serendipita sp. 399]|nr:GPI mannosyltransferase 1 [Serendipita sp. 399]
MSKLVNRTISALQFRHIIGLAITIRLALIVYADYHDRNSLLKYTDVDYRVFSDASRSLQNTDGDDAVAKGILGRVLPLGDPYNRATYRYTPLLAVLMLPNQWLHPAFGKLLFAVSDIGIGLLLKQISQGSVVNHPNHPGRSESRKGLTRSEGIISLLWLLNPFSINISTRGSAESLLGLMVISTLAFALQKRWVACAMMLALSVHWKIYPVIYASSILPFIGADDNSKVAPNTLQYWIQWCLNRKRLAFIYVFSGSLFLLLALTYIIWGFPVLEHTYLYHIGRTDHRHNFSVYFYPLYLSLTSSNGTSNSQSRILALAAFVPQMILSIGGGFLLAQSLALQGRNGTINTKEVRPSKVGTVARKDPMRHLPFIWLVQTFIFVTLNKVCTSQYFMWYIWFLPLAIPHLAEPNQQGGGVSTYKAWCMVALWVGAQAVWLSQGYLLEFMGKEVFLHLWVCGLIMLWTDSWIVGSLIDGYRWD